MFRDVQLPALEEDEEIVAKAEDVEVDEETEPVGEETYADN